MSNDPFAGYFDDDPQNTAAQPEPVQVDTPPHDPVTGEIYETSPPLQTPSRQEEPPHIPVTLDAQLKAALGLIQQNATGLQALITIANATAKEETLNKNGEAQGTTQKMVQSLIGDVALIKTEVLASQGKLDEITTIAEGRDLASLKEDLNRTITNLNRAIAARNKKPLNKKLITLIAGATLTISAAFIIPAFIPSYPAEIISALDKCQQAVSRDQKAYTCKIIVRP